MAAYRRNHIVPRAQLEMWTVDSRLECQFVKGGSRFISPRDAAVRTDFYADRQSTGEVWRYFERAMGPLESKAGPLIKTVEERWPYDRRSRATVAEFLALQVVRSPGWRDFFEDVRKDSLAEKQAEMSTDDQRRQLADLSSSDRFRLELMHSQLAKAACALGSMHWTLLQFREPRLAISDHPVVPVPIGGGRAKPIPDRGLLNTIEFLVPLTPQAAIVCTWVDQPDDVPPRRGTHHQLMTINSGVIAQAEKQWFHRPGIKPPRAGGPVVAVGCSLFPGYDDARATASDRRREVDGLVNALIDRDEDTGEFPMVSVKRSAAA